MSERGKVCLAARGGKGKERKGKDCLVPLVTMYARRGDIDHAFKLFVRHTERDIVLWNSMILCYAQHGRGKKALEVFSELENEGLQLDGITFVGVLTACNHAGLVDEGSRYFKSMTSIYHVQPTMEHYACMVDLYSRAGQLESAMSFINEMPFPTGPTFLSMRRRNFYHSNCAYKAKKQNQSVATLGFHSVDILDFCHARQYHITMDKFQNVNRSLEAPLESFPPKKGKMKANI
ncbi:putative pentatricopeptide repeat-containing protein [Nymphaea thermarum]|nr:putative pentatricopeptide repeat-containing protein [Nymphaea thermarum]